MLCMRVQRCSVSARAAGRRSRGSCGQRLWSRAAPSAAVYGSTRTSWHDCDGDGKARWRRSIGPWSRDGRSISPPHPPPSVRSVAFRWCPLRSPTYHTVTLDGCRRCRGIWTDHGELTQLGAAAPTEPVTGAPLRSTRRCSAGPPSSNHRSLPEGGCPTGSPLPRGHRKQRNTPALRRAKQRVTAFLLRRDPPSICSAVYTGKLSL